MPKFEAYYASSECGDQHAKAPKRVTFKHLGKSHLYAATIEAATPDAAFAQLRQETPEALERINQHAPKRGMRAGDVLLQAADPGTMLIRTQDGWLARDVTE